MTFAGYGVQTPAHDLLEYLQIGNVALTVSQPLPAGVPNNLNAHRADAREPAPPVDSPAAAARRFPHPRLFSSVQIAPSLRRARSVSCYYRP
jgi:hypothetical protein